jgi:hypothetical protein
LQINDAWILRRLISEGKTLLENSRILGQNEAIYADFSSFFSNTSIVIITSAAGRETTELVTALKKK